MYKWDINDVPSQRGRIAIITGASSGIGYEAALELAKKDACVIMACRNREAAKKARKKILGIYSKAPLTIISIDLSSLKSVRDFTEKFRKQFEQLDILVNNSGIMMSPFSKLLIVLKISCALTGLLNELLIKTIGSRVITLISLSFKWAPINFDDLHFEKVCNKKKAYGQSIRACLVFTYELNRKLSVSGKNTISLAANLGLSNTNLDRYFPTLINI